MDNWKHDLIELRSKHRQSYKYFAKRFGKTEEEVREVIQKYKLSGTINDSPTKHIALQNMTPKTVQKDWDGNKTVIFGLISDTHINSKYTQLTYLHQFYDICKQRGVHEVYHAGDIDEGEQMRMGHQYECYQQGADDHVKEIINVYPNVPGVKTFFITGNHDASIYKRCGVDIGKTIQFNRADMVYLGRDVSKVELTPECVLELRHPWDGSAYAISYKPQKMIEAMEADSKPRILAIGNYHKLEYLFYRNIHCFQTGCFQSQTPFLRGKGISSHLGGWIVTVEVDSKGHVQRIIPEMIPFYRGIDDDYLNFTSKQ